MSGPRRWPRLTPLELRLKRVNDATNARFENLERFYDRRPIAESYARGDVHLHIELTCQRVTDSKPFRLIHEAVWLVLAIKGDGVSDERDGGPMITLDGIQMPVFVGIGEFPDLSNPTDSCVRLAALDGLDVSGVESIEPTLFWRSCTFRG